MTLQLNKILSLPSFVLGCFLILISCVVFYSFGNQKPFVLKSLDNQIMDIMFNIRGPVPDSGQVIIVDIDEKSLTHFGQWPWPRNLLADLTTHLFKNGARVVGFDIVFAEKDRASPVYFFKNLDEDIKGQIPKNTLADIFKKPSLDYDTLFGQALSKGPSVLGYAFQMKKDFLKLEDQVPFPSSIIKITPDTLNFQNLSLIPAYRAIINHPSVSMAQSEGFFNVFEDPFGTTRKVPLLMEMDHIPYPSLALEIYRIGTANPVLTIQASDKIKTPQNTILGIHIGNQFIPTDSFGQLSINFRGPAHTFTYISALDVLTKPDVPAIKDKFVLIGSSAVGLFDLKTTPLSNVIPGTEINANIIDNLIQSDPFTYDRYTEIGLTYFLIISGGLLISLLLSTIGPAVGSFGAFAFLSFVLAYNYYHFFLNNRHVGIAYPILTCVGIVFFITVFNAFRERKTKRFIHKAFSHYVAPDVVTHLIKNPETLSLKGEERELTVLFLDIRGFTSLSENMTSRELGNFMNDFLSRISHIIIKNDGTVDKFIGDAVMAFWGAPKSDPYHAYKAVHAALDIKTELARLDTHNYSNTIPRIQVGIGINSGVVSVGNFGSKERFDYTVMGDNVNLASRLEGANKNYGTTILISEATRKMTDQNFFCRYVDKVAVKGRQKPVDVYEPLSIGQPSAELVQEVTLFEKGIKAYQQQDFQGALAIIDKLHAASPSQLYQSYIDRIHGFIKYPPQFKWDGSERRARLPVNKLLTK